MLLLTLLIWFLLYYYLYIREGLDNKYQEYDMSNPNNAMILAQQNAGNISYLKERIDALEEIHSKVKDLEVNVDQLNKSVEGLVIQQGEYITDTTGGEPVTITGLD